MYRYSYYLVFQVPFTRILTVHIIQFCLIFTEYTREFVKIPYNKIEKIYVQNGNEHIILLNRYQINYLEVWRPVLGAPAPTHLVVHRPEVLCELVLYQPFKLDLVFFSVLRIKLEFRQHW